MAKGTRHACRLVTPTRASRTEGDAWFVVPGYAKPDAEAAPGATVAHSNVTARADLRSSVDAEFELQMGEARRKRARCVVKTPCTTMFEFTPRQHARTPQRTRGRTTGRDADAAAATETTAGARAYSSRRVCVARGLSTRRRDESSGNRL